MDTDSLKARQNPDYPTYPQSGSHQWGAFPWLAIETGGYGDLELIHPWTGETLWIGKEHLPALADPNENPAKTVADLLRQVADAVEAADWGRAG